MRSGGLPAGSSRALRLDPTALPVRFSASDSAADERVRHIELHRERVVVRRAVRGMRMALNMPVSAFLGVGIKLLPPQAETEAAVAVVLEHRDPALALPLFVSADFDDVMAHWQAWSEALAMPLLVTDDFGSAREPVVQTDQVRIEEPCSRRRRRSALKKRRPSMPLRRRPGVVTADTPVHRGEREIIARN